MTASDLAALAHIEEALEVAQCYMRAYERGAAFECELVLIEALNAGVRLALPLLTAALRGADNWDAIRALSLALAMYTRSWHDSFVPRLQGGGTWLGVELRSPLPLN